jgi:hypothetical protein
LSRREGYEGNFTGVRFYMFTGNPSSEKAQAEINKAKAAGASLEIVNCANIAAYVRVTCPFNTVVINNYETKKPYKGPMTADALIQFVNILKSKNPPK